MAFLMALVLVILLASDKGSTSLFVDFYKESCSVVEEIVKHNVDVALLKDPRMAASLLHLHFHDCFVKGCDSSILLDTHRHVVSEKQAGPNLNTVRGFDVIEKIKVIIEEACQQTVSCIDILALASHYAVELVVIQLENQGA
ncbi:hypothetical protein Scep_026038 [Stephania cephalantha]|uniref:Plant heme peroxidase family profile domain-containing protein n=1 Tax=Stephania cephalantha TaxID=152367 RepID=A0AAP0ET96_9MAGN